MIKFLSTADSIRLDGERHLANSIGYASRGLFGYSDGSMRKAIRNFKRANHLDMRLDSFTRRVMEPIASDFAKRIADRIMGY